MNLVGINHAKTYERCLRVVTVVISEDGKHSNHMNRSIERLLEPDEQIRPLTGYYSVVTRSVYLRMTFPSISG